MLRCASWWAGACLALAVTAAQAAPWHSPVGRTPSSTPVVPVAWSGIWSYTDSLYDCSGPVLLAVTTGLDTLCTGSSYDVGETGDLVISCDGTYDDTSADITCTAQVPTFPGCTATFTIRSISARTGDSYSTVTTANTVFPPAGCGPLPNTCTQTNRHATRIAPEPPVCATPARPASWGSIKSVYR